MAEYYFGEYVDYNVLKPFNFSGRDAAEKFLNEWEMYLIKKFPDDYKMLSRELIDRPATDECSTSGTLGIKIRVLFDDNQELSPHLLKYDLSRI